MYEDSGIINGILHPIFDISERVIITRRLRAMQSLSTHLYMARTYSNLWASVASALAEVEADLPCAAIYSAKEDAGTYILINIIALVHISIQYQVT